MKQRVFFVKPFATCVLVLCCLVAGLLLLTANPSLAPADSKSSGQALTTAADTSNVPGKWESWPSGWYFKKNDGSYATGLFSPKGDTRWYYCNGTGRMKTGWINVNDRWYYAESNGAMASGWKGIGYYWYYFDPDENAHPARTGFFSDGSDRYYANSNCQMKTGWIKDKGTWYFAYSNGTLANGWLSYRGGWYYLDPKLENYPARTGFFADGNDRYYADSNCKMKTGWIKSGGKWYYANSNGTLASGWTGVGRYWYYLDPEQENYPALTGYFKEGGKEYFCNSNCVLIQEGWAKISSCEERYSASDGALTQFYADRSDGLRIMNAKGEYLSGWQQLSNSWFYLDPQNNKKAVKGWHSVGGKSYYFQKNYVWFSGEIGPLVSRVNAVSSDWYVSVTGTDTIPQWLIERLNDDMLSLWNSGADVGFVLVDIKTGATIAGNASKYFYSASTMKGPYVCALSQHWPSKAVNWKGTIRETISYSSNSGYATLRYEFGSGVMNTYMHEAGVYNLSSSRYYQDIRARDLAKLWVRNYHYFENGNSTRKWTWPYFVHTSHSFIDAELGSTYWVYSKPGWYWGNPQVYNDAGIVFKDDTPYVIAILSSGASGTHDAKLQKLVRDLNSTQGYIQ